MDTKPIWASKTFWGTIITFAGPFITKWSGLDGLDLFGVEDNIVSLIGAVLAIYGRVTAAKAVTIK